MFEDSGKCNRQGFLPFVAGRWDDRSLWDVSACICNYSAWNGRSIIVNKHLLSHDILAASPSLTKSCDFSWNQLPFWALGREGEKRRGKF
jgi:hypothetical protein